VPSPLPIDQKHLRFSPIEIVYRISFSHYQLTRSSSLDRKSMKELRRAIGLSFKCSLSLDGSLYPLITQVLKRGVLFKEFEYRLTDGRELCDESTDILYASQESPYFSVCRGGISIIAFAGSISIPL